MKNLSILVYLFLLVQLGCAWTSSRNPAGKEVVSIDDVLTIKRSEASLSETGYLGSFKQFYDGGLNQIISSIEESSSLDENTAFKFQVENEKGRNSFKLLYSKDAFKDLTAYTELVNFSHSLRMSREFVTPMSCFEAIYNAEKGDPIALNNLLKIKANSHINPLLNISSLDDLKPRLDEYGQKSEILQSQIKELNKVRKEKEAARKAIMDTLDKASDDEQLKALIAKNDRKGVVALLKKYLPFEQMPPFEKRFWEMQLDIIEHPVALKDRVFIYRGLADDFIHQAIVDGKEVDKDTALREGKAFLMSTVLVKNQGSWNRRLRSLQAMYEKFIASNSFGKSNMSNEYTQSARITTMFQRHSKEPKGSPFLSFTPRFKIAKNFGMKRTAGFLVDPRIINFNFTSVFEGEKEFLMPLMTFPDEMVCMWDIEKHGSLENNNAAIEALLKQQTLARLEEKYGKNKAPEIMDSILKRSEDFFSPVYAKEDKVMDNAPVTGFLNKIIDAIKEEKQNPPPAVQTTNKQTCFDMMKVFWAIP